MHALAVENINTYIELDKVRGPTCTDILSIFQVRTKGQLIAIIGYFRVIAS